MSMSEYECMHDCTCCATGEIQPYDRAENATCDLPAGHAGEHWDPVWDYFWHPESDLM